MKGFIIFLTVFLFLFSCSVQEVCDDDLLPEAIATFQTFKDGKLIDTIISGVYMHGIREQVPNSLLYDSAKVSKIFFPLDPNSPQSSFVLRIQDVSDTIHIIHTSTVYLISFTCGFLNDFTITKIMYSKNNIKDIELIKEYVNAEETDVEEHFKFYF